MKEENNNKKGFTLVETLVAIGILSLAITATFTAIQSSLKTSNIAKDQITAFYLAQEAVEYIKNKRDENALHNTVDGVTTWLNGLSNCASPSTCTIDSGAQAVTLCSGTCPVLRQNPASYLYGYNAGWTATNFTRSVQYTTLSTNEIIVTVTVSWTNHGVSKTFQVSELIFNRTS